MKYVLVALILLSAVAGAQDGPSIGYPTVAAAIDALSEDPSVEFGEESGWMVADSREGEAIVLWTFTSPMHAAHPSAIKRTMYPVEGAWQMEMRILCEAGEDACDELVNEFQELNDALQHNLESQRPADSDRKKSKDDLITHDGMQQR